MREKEFTDIIDSHKVVLKKYGGVSRLAGYTKLFLVFLLCVALFLIFTQGFPTVLILAGSVVLVVLILLWIYHHRIYEKLNYSKSIIAINLRNLARISGKWAEFDDVGADFINRNHQYSGDLDIVGYKSLFQFLNTTHTWHGRRALADDLLKPEFSESEILSRQNAIAELSRDVAFANHMEHCFSRIGLHRSAQRLVEELSTKQVFIKNKPLRILLMFTPLVTATFIAITIIFRLDSLYLVAAFVALTQFVVWLISTSKTKNYLADVSRLPYKLAVYSEVIETFKHKNFSSEKLKNLQVSLGGSKHSAAQAIRELSKISEVVNVRYNGLLWFVLNILLLWDIECSFLFEKWRTKYAPEAEGWFLALGEFETLLCLSNFPNICSHACMPTITKQKTIEAKSLGHPLISNNARINNDVLCDDSIFIISGSNMSGKTTFIRTVGINLVLARAGCFVCAEKMSFPLIEIITSMRVIDNLSEGMSTFHAELVRIKSIVELAEKTPDMIFLIDEIFKGTNSVDRLSGAKTVLAKLNALGVLGMITTHDLDLCEIENQYSRILNYSFSENYHDNQIHFDYTLKPGKSKTTNAKYLMKMIGLCEE